MDFTGSESILIVDDEDVILEMASDILTSAGYEVETTTSGRQALRRLNERKFDLLFTDVIMPGMTGYRLVKEALHIFPEMKILLTSGYMVSHDLTDVPPALLEKVVKKPYVDMKLRMAVRECLDS